MLSSDGNENSQKTLGLISKETTLHVQHKCSTLFFWTFLCRCFARRQRETSRHFRVTRFMEEMLYVVLLFTFFSLPLTVTFSGRQYFSFSHRLYKIFMLFLKRNWSPLFFTSGSSSFSEDIKIKSKERISFVVVIFYL